MRILSEILRAFAFLSRFFEPFFRVRIRISPRPQDRTAASTCAPEPRAPWAIPISAPARSMYTASIRHSLSSSHTRLVMFALALRRRRVLSLHSHSDGPSYGHTRVMLSRRATTGDQEEHLSPRASCTRPCLAARRLSVCLGFEGVVVNPTAVEHPHGSRLPAARARTLKGGDALEAAA